MRDVSAELLPDDTRLSRDDHRRIMAAANATWEAFWNEPIRCLVPLQRQLALTAPSTAERERGTRDLLPKQLEAAWEAFAEVADADVREAVSEVLDDPAPLAAELARCGTTLIHGDLRDEQLGLANGRLVLIDWGLATQGHPAVEPAWYLMHDAWRIAATRDQLVDDFRRARGDHDDPHALDLGLLCGLVMYGWIIGHSAVIHPDPAERRWALDELSWWQPRAGGARARGGAGLSRPAASHPPLCPKTTRCS